MKRNNVCYCFDKNFINQGMIAIKSLIYNNKDVPIDIYILELGLDENDIQRIKEMQADNKKIYIIDVEKEKKAIESVDAGDWNISTLVRLLMEELLPNDVDKVLYIDSDTIVQGNIERVFGTDIDNCLGAAVLDKFINEKEKNRIGINVKSRYFNAGVMFVNLVKWRELKIGRKCIEILQKNPTINTMPDQNALNILLENQVKLLPLSCNVDGYTTLLEYDLIRKIIPKENICFIDREEYEEARKNPIIVHFIGWYMDKPWIEGNLQPMESQYDFYAEMLGIKYEKVARKKCEGFLSGNIREKIRKKIKKAIQKENMRRVTRVYCRGELFLKIGSKIKGGL